MGLKIPLLQGWFSWHYFYLLEFYEVYRKIFLVKISLFATQSLVRDLYESEIDFKVGFKILIWRIHSWLVLERPEFDV